MRVIRCFMKASRSLARLYEEKGVTVRIRRIGADSSSQSAQGGARNVYSKNERQPTADGLGGVGQQRLLSVSFERQVALR